MRIATEKTHLEEIDHVLLEDGFACGCCKMKLEVVYEYVVVVVVADHQILEYNFLWCHFFDGFQVSHYEYRRLCSSTDCSVGLTRKAVKTFLESTVD
jgi:hypothetical protein